MALKLVTYIVALVALVVGVVIGVTLIGGLVDTQIYVNGRQLTPATEAAISQEVISRPSAKIEQFTTLRVGAFQAREEGTWLQWFVFFAPVLLLLFLAYLMQSFFTRRRERRVNF
jgi:uncharacterized protein involved in response to NO